MDGSSNSHGRRTGLIILSPVGIKLQHALQFGFRASNNKAKYKAIIAALKIFKALRAIKLINISDSQLVVN